MFSFRPLRHREVRRTSARRPLVENLEGRRLLSFTHRHPTAMSDGVAGGGGSPPAEFSCRNAGAQTADGTGSNVGTDTVRFFYL